MNASQASQKEARPSGLKQVVKSTARPVARTMWPLIELAASMSSRFNPGLGTLQVVWEETWTERFDRALDLFAPPPGCTMDQYRALVQPTEYPKRHALVLENDRPVSIISLRRRKTFWEPVAYQVISGFIAPARDKKTLGRALSSLGIDLRIEAGLSADVYEMEPTYVYPYDFIRIDLQSDYEAYWNLNDKEHLKHVSIARKKCKKMHMVANEKSDIDWIVNTWRNYWKDAPENEIVAAPDRINFWNTLNTSSDDPGELTVQTYTLYLGEERLAGMVATSLDGTQTMQCLAQVPEYRRFSTGTRIQHMILEHSARAGVRYIDLGGGHGYKSYWGPHGGQRFGAGFCPKILNRLHWVHEG